MGPQSAGDIGVSPPPAIESSCVPLGVPVAQATMSAIEKTPALPMTEASAVLSNEAAASEKIAPVKQGPPVVNGFTGHGHLGSDDEEDGEEVPEANYSVPEDCIKEYGVDPRDANTPDKWISRHPELIRLTGKHPFNCEPPLERLVDQGFITPVPLHYVRNHGYVPAAEWDSWRVEVSGLVKRPMSFSMADLQSMPSRTLPVTLVCVGNRRKEQNMIKKTRGFNWGAAGLSTSVWKGVLLRDVLRLCGILPAHRGAAFVCFDGQETLPGPTGSGGSTYGTSITRARALDPAQDVILAYEQNGERLSPDHGFPVRVIIPGYIGGRMVKWLRKIEVSSEESQNYYHFYDNRVLPPFVDSERADAERWWYKPDYICNELSINSATSHPKHNEELSLTPPPGASARMTYLLKGYAYSGGGRKVTRVEVTLDNGASWCLADLVHPEQPTPAGKWWCWCFWSLRVNVSDLVAAPSREIAVRAWDEGTNTQPQELTWNVLGMMNNPWFRIKIHPVQSATGLGLRFEHPTVAGATPGGWMDKGASFAANSLAPPSCMTVPEAVEAGTISKSPVAPGTSSIPAPTANEGAPKAPSSGLRQIPLSEVQGHDTAESPWIVVDGRVYDCTRFLKDHPGGAESILINAGTDCTEEFDAIHSRKAKAMLADFLIGEVVAESAQDQVVPAAAFTPSVVIAATVKQQPVALDPKQRLPFKLVRKDILSRDVRRFRFALPSEEHVLGLPVGKHIFLSARINGALVMRAYTPSSSDDEVGYFELVVKIYFKNEHPNFPDGGLFSQHLESLELGDTVDVKGPIGHIHYRGKGVFTSDGTEHRIKRIAMMAGGTGITPMYQVIKAILKDEGDLTQMWLIYANRTVDDILLREDLDRWATEHSTRFHVWYTVEAPPPKGWLFSSGRVNKEMMAKHLPPAGERTVAFLCGPPPMLKFGCIPNLESLGYSSDQMFCF